MGRRIGSVALAALLGLGMGTTGAHAGALRAEFQGIPLALHAVARHHCHDAAYPVIRCFVSAAARDRDLRALGGPVVGRRAGRTIAAVNYVTIFEHENYGGASYTTSAAQTNLGSIGWNDQVTSFKSLNGEHPKFWRDSGYSGTSWHWLAGAWVANVGGGANDQFSSMKNVP